MQPSQYKIQGKRVVDPTGWWFSEKLDGIKMRWIDGKLFTRSGKQIHAPKCFVDSLQSLFPDVNIEGEAYLGKGTFADTASLRASANNDSFRTVAWSRVTFHIFDLIDYSIKWFERQRVLYRKMKRNKSSRFHLVDWFKIESSDHLENEFSQIVRIEGEGIVLADPDGKYEDGHVSQILKYKAKQDAEGEIIGYNTSDDGLRLKSLIVRVMPTRGRSLRMSSRSIAMKQRTAAPPGRSPLLGRYATSSGQGSGTKEVTFNLGIGLKVKQRFGYREKFPIGFIVTYWYELMSNSGKPRSPVFKGLRIFD